MLTLLPDDPLALGVLDELRYRDTTLPSLRGWASVGHDGL
jgi:hypothetical protein